MQKACIFGAIRFHGVKTNDKDEMTGPALAKAIASDVKKGLIPFYCAAILGTTATCAFDDLKQIGTVCEKAGVWLHIDAAYAGASFICPEFRPLLDGVEIRAQRSQQCRPRTAPERRGAYFKVVVNRALSGSIRDIRSASPNRRHRAVRTAGLRSPQPHCPQPSEGDFCQLLTCKFFVIAEERPELPSHPPFLIHSFADSFTLNPHKWLLTGFNCSALCTGKFHLVESSAPSSCGLCCGCMGSKACRHISERYVRRRRRRRRRRVVVVVVVVVVVSELLFRSADNPIHVELALEFEKLVTADDRFQVTNTVTHGLVCFKLRQCSNELNELFLANLTKDRRVYLTACVSNGDYFLRFVVSARNAESSDIECSWKVISEVATATLEDTKSRAK
ncbi:Aromatic-L-amino-acid decarboxylase [Lamellibrachia satsuma]|nr:Aromatic-L-amino-acid decarboxylase [Lamellibrachia satsuma]